mgnify:CR=1 FL=1
MAVDYDLVVIGTNRAGWWLARAAAERDARVAWVLYPDYLDQGLQPGDFDRVQAMGVNIIPGGGQFCHGRLLLTEQGKCSARAFAITLPNLFGAAPEFEFDSGCTEMVLPIGKCRNLVVGEQPIACAWAQRLVAAGHEVSLVTSHSRVLPDWDLDISRSLQAQLESEGIEIYTRQEIQTIQCQEGRYRVYSDRQVFEVNRVFLPQQSSIYQDLALAKAKVALGSDQVLVNSYGQTSNRRIYWGENLAELTVILSNVLYFPWRRQTLGLTVGHTLPLIVKLQVPNFKLRRSLVRLKLQSDAYIAELVCDRAGRILAFWGMGQGVMEAAELLMVAQTQGLKIQALGISSNLVGQLAWRFAAGQLQRSPGDWRWHWFNLRRDLGDYLG